MDPHKDAPERGDCVAQEGRETPRLTIERQESVTYSPGEGTTSVPLRTFIARFPGLPYAGQGRTEEEAIRWLADLLGGALRDQRLALERLRDRVSEAIGGRRP